ncbi:MAG: spore coat U domain-containing protein [Verrucomicrobia subdivision 3 bacterium]|nr:spore coat U domain-containing protein [Limisphaerales bacterium]
MLRLLQTVVPFRLALAPVLLACLSQGKAEAATTTANFQSQITIVADCQIPSTNTLNFGSNGALTANVDATTTFSVQCTNTTPYDIGLNQGTTAGGTTATRLMTSGSATVSYQMFSDAARTVNWGNTVGTDTVAGTGNGAAQSYTIFGRVPAQTTPASGLYTDTVTITVTF